MKWLLTLLSNWIMPEPEIKVERDDVDPRQLNIEIKKSVIVSTHLVFYDDGSCAVYEDGRLFATSHNTIWA